MSLDLIYLPVFILWAFGVLLILFRRGLEWIWKLSILFLFVFYGIWFFDEIHRSWNLFTLGGGRSVASLFKAASGALTIFFLIFWPAALLIAFFNSSVDSSRAILRPLLVITIFFWLFWFLDMLTPPFVEDAANWVIKLIQEWTDVIAQPPTE